MTPHSSFGGLISRSFCVLVLLCFIHSFPRVLHGQGTVVDCLTSNQLSVIKPSDANYASSSSSYNLRRKYKPVVIVAAANNQHVSDAVLCASKYNLKVQPRSGGHSYGS